MAIQPTKIKSGQKVTFTGRNGIPYTGKVIEINEGVTGEFAKVNVGDARNPIFKSVRPSQLTRV